MTRLTLAHITHEANEKIGGIGTVLEGVVTSPVYQQHVGRTILVGPYVGHIEVAAEDRLGEDGQVLYSTVDGIDRNGLGGKMHPIEWAFNVAIVYGRKMMRIDGDDRTGEVEVLLIDVFRTNPDRLAQFKHRLNETFGLDSMRHEAAWGYEEYVRLAEPAFYSLLALLQDDELPCVMFSHEFMGMPSALKAVLDGQRQFRTIFHAHECGTARAIVENHPGHDTMFYNVLHEARRRGRYVQDVFGDQSASFRHALVSRSHLCDGIIAVGQPTAEEMHFLDRHFDHHLIDLVHNGIPEWNVTPSERERSRQMLANYAQTLIGGRPDVLMTHVTRPVISKAIWRDFAVCHELDQRFAADDLSGVLFILTTAAGTRRPQDVRHMEAEYGWPRHHRQDYPDLVGPEIEINRHVESFNALHKHIQTVLVNQFSWSRARIGDRLPSEMDFADLRRATDVEFGMACYEPFGISPLEPLGCGAICVISNVCGCAGFVRQATAGSVFDNVFIADYTKLDRTMSLEQMLQIGQTERDAIEQRVAAEIAEHLMLHLPRSAADRARLLRTGQSLIGGLGWDHVLREHMVPMIRRVVAEGEAPTLPAVVPALR